MKCDNPEHGALEATADECIDCVRDRMHGKDCAILALQTDLEATKLQIDEAREERDLAEQNLEKANARAIERDAEIGELRAKVKQTERLVNDLKKLIKRVDNYFSRPEIRVHETNMVLIVPSDLAMEVRAIAEGQ